MKKQHIPRSVVAINTRLHSEKMGVLFQQEVMRKSSAMYPLGGILLRSLLESTIHWALERMEAS